MEQRNVLPGDRIASAEEYAAGPGVFDDGGTLRASVAGRTELDEAERSACTRAAAAAPIARAGDLVIGEVAAVMASMMAIAIRYVNGREVTNGVECILATRNIRKRIVALAGDVMALRVIGPLNGTIHASVDEPELGVLFTRCRRCGGRVITYRDAVKCAECSWIDDRKLSSEFGKGDFVKA